VAYLSLRNKVKKRPGELERAKLLEKYVVANIQGEDDMERIQIKLGDRHPDFVRHTL
jgi:hypothetical protein